MSTTHAWARRPGTIPRVRFRLIAALSCACVAASLAACAGTPSPAAAAVHAALAREPASPSLLYVDAALAARRDPALALADLRALDAAGWDNPLEPGDFAPLAGNTELAAIAARISARARSVSTARVAATVSEPDVFPEGIAVDPRNGTLYLSSLWQRRIVRIASDGRVDSFADAAAGLYAVLGLHVDERRNLLWAASDAEPSLPGLTRAERGSAVLLGFDLATGRVAVRAVAPGRGPHLLNDMAIADDGTVYVTDSEGGGVFALAPGAATLTPFVAARTLVYPNGIVVDGTRVLVAHLWGVAVVPRDGAPMRELAAAPGIAVGGVDGLALVGDQLYAVQNGLGRPRVVRFGLDATRARVVEFAVLENAHPALDVPTTLAVDEPRRALFVVAASHIPELGPHGPTRHHPSSTILSLPLAPSGTRQVATPSLSRYH